MKQMLRLEYRLFFSDRSAAMIAVLFLLATAYGLVNGYARVRDQQRKMAASDANQAELFASKWKKAPPEGLAPALLRDDLANFRAVLPAGPGALLANGQSDLLPQSYIYRKFNEDSPSIPTVDGHSLSNLFPEKITSNPLRLLTGSVDLSFVVLYLYPLLVIALGYDVFSRDRESGTLAIALSQPIPWSRFMGTKIAVRAQVTFFCGVALPALLVAALQWGLFGFVDWTLWAWWLAVVTLYVAFWLVLTLVVSMASGESIRSAVSAVGGWILLIVMVPTVATLLAETLVQDDLAAKFVAAEREIRGDVSEQASRIQTQLRAEFAKLFPADRFSPAEIAAARATVKLPLSPVLEDKPLLREFLQREPAASAGQTLEQLLFLNQLAREASIEERLRPVIVRDAEQQRNRDRISAAFMWISPVVGTQAVLAEIAGTGPAGHRALLQQVDTYVHQRDQFFARMVAEGRLVHAEDLHLFRLQADEVSAVFQRTILPSASLILLLFLASVLGWRTHRRGPMRV